MIDEAKIKAWREACELMKHAFLPLDTSVKVHTAAREALPALLDEVERLTRERDEAIGVLLDCAPDGANAYPVGREGVYLAAEKINAARVALLQESARRLDVLREMMASIDAALLPGGSVAFTNLSPYGKDRAMRELDRAGLLVEENGVKRVRG